jgi:hypothetical protein
MTPARRCLVLMLAACVGAANAAVPASTAEQLVRESGLAAQLEQMPKAVVASMGETAQALGLPPPLTAQLQRAGQQAFEPRRLLLVAVTTTAGDLDAATAEEALRWWRSPEGQQIRALEDEAAARMTQNATGWLSEANATYAGATPGRRARLDEIERAVRGADLTADLQIQTALALLRGIAAAAPPQAVDDLRRAQEQLQRQRPQFVAAARGVMLAYFAICYAKVGDAHLDRYIAYLRSVEGQRATQSLVRATEKAASEAAGELGRNIPVSLGAPAR